MLRRSLNLYRSAYGGLTREVWWLSAVMFVNRSGTMVVPFLTVYLTSVLDFSIGQAGMVMGSFGLGAMMGAFLGGRLADQIGFRRVQFWSLLLNGIMFFALYQMQTVWQFCVCIFLLTTLGESFRPANAAAIAWYSSTSGRTRSYSLNRLAINLGVSIGPAMGGLLAAVGYQWLFWVDGLTCILAAILLLVVFPREPVASVAGSESASPGPATPWKDRVYLRFLLLLFLVACCFLPLFSLVPVFYKEKMHFGETVIGLLLAVNGLLIALVEMVLVYRIEGKRRSGTYISAGAFLIALSYLTLTLGSQLAVAVMAMLLITFGEMLLFPFVNSFWTSRSTERNRGQYAALFSVAFSAAHVLAPTLGAQVIHVAGFHVLWYCFFVISTLAALGFYHLLKQY